MTTALLPPVSCTYITRTPTNLLIVHLALAPFPDSAVKMGISLGFPVKHPVYLPISRYL